MDHLSADSKVRRDSRKPSSELKIPDLKTADGTSQPLHSVRRYEAVNGQEPIVLGSSGKARGQRSDVGKIGDPTVPQMYQSRSA
jgi:hypothetical protein